MPQRSHHAGRLPGNPLAHLAVAQFLLFEATLESLSVFGERLTRIKPDASAGPSGPEPSVSMELSEPFRVRYACFRRMLAQEARH
jgi:hypothetical protein